MQRYGVGLKLLGVYCHQSPKVRYAGMRNSSCELGDLLTCHFHEDKSGRRTANALLLQAKMTAHQPHHIGRAESDQLRLYSEWPQFEYVTGPLKSHAREVTPAARHRGAQYLQIDPRSPDDPISGLMRLDGTYPAGVCMADHVLVNHSTLEHELLNVLCSLSGRGITPHPPTDTDIGWSRVVWDMIEVSLAKVFTRHRSGYNRQPRATGGPGGDGHYFIAGESDIELEEMTMRLFGPNRLPKLPPFEPTHEDAEGGGWSTSLLLVETIERTER